MLQIFLRGLVCIKNRSEKIGKLLLLAYQVLQKLKISFFSAGVL